jgi:hypothetical protein
VSEEIKVLKNCLFNMEYAAHNLCPCDFLDDVPPMRTIESTGAGTSLWIAIRDLKEVIDEMSKNSGKS